MSKNLNKCVFFDRDGVLNKDKGYISKVRDIEIFSKVGQAIYECNKKEYLVIIITNQSGIGRGLITLKQLSQIRNYIKKKIKKNKAIINDIFYCPFHPTGGRGKYKKNSFDRKPNPGMLLKAIKKWKIDPKKSFMIGDQKSDYLAAHKSKIYFEYKSNRNNLLDQIKNIIR